jgi:S1-C subfamily serine protease
MSRLNRSLAIAALAAFAIGVVGCGSSKKSSSPAKPVALSQPDLVAKVSKSTVEVFGREGKNQVGGTGVVVDAAKGLIVTNAHVISGLATVRVRFGTTEGPATVVGQAPCEDLALVKAITPPPGMASLPFGSALKVRAGQKVTALGYPGSLQDPANAKLTSTVGTVSVDGTLAAKPDPGLPNYSSVIQHQAPINPGNSGGPLVDEYGQLIGINTLLNPGKQEQNYAISVDHVKQFLPTLEAGKNVAYVGWDLFPANQLTTADVRSLAYNYKTGNVGMVVLGVDPGSQADKHHFQFGDYVQYINGTEIDTVGQACDILQSNENKIIDVKGYDMYKTGKSYHEKVRPE